MSGRGNEDTHHLSVLRIAEENRLPLLLVSAAAGIMLYRWLANAAERKIERIDLEHTPISPYPRARLYDVDESYIPASDARTRIPTSATA